MFVIPRSHFATYFLIQLHVRVFTRSARFTQRFTYQCYVADFRQRTLPMQESGQPELCSSRTPAYMPSCPFVEGEEGGQHQAAKGGQVIPADCLPKICTRKHSEDAGANNLLNSFELRRRINRVANVVRRNSKAVFKERYTPAHRNHDPKPNARIFQLPVPCDRHEHVGA